MEDWRVFGKGTSFEIVDMEDGGEEEVGDSERV